MAPDKQYKKRVISESESDDDTPLAAAAASTSTSANMAKSGSNGSGHDPQLIAEGSALLKQAAGDAQPKPGELHLEDAQSRHETVAGGFEAAIASVSHPEQTNGTNGSNGHSGMDVDKAGAESSDDDDKPLASAANGKSSALPSFKKKKEKSSKQDKPASKPKAKPVVKKEDEDVKMASASSDEDVPLASKSNGNKAADSDDDDDGPLAKKAAAAPASKKKANGRKASAETEDNDDDADSENEPIAKKQKKPAKGKKRAKKESDGSDFEDDEDVMPKKPAKKRAKKEDSGAPSNAAKALTKKRVKKEDSATPSASGSKKGKAKKEEDGSQAGDGEDDEAKWWLNQQDDDGPKWTTLQHQGVLFPPEYVPLPKNVKLKYDGKIVDLPPESEEVAGFFAAMLETDHAKDATFQKNFFSCFCETLAEYPPRNKITIDPVNGFARLDFQEMADYFAAEREKKKSLSKDEKKRIKEQKDELEKNYLTCLVDGREEKVGNFRLEPPGLFRGRGEHPKKGMLKKRLEASDITLNIGREADVPEPPPGQKWAKIQHDNTVTWLATWKENINGGTKYVFLSANSAWKGQSDWKKFEKARTLKEHIATIRADYTADLTSKEMAARQRATAVYFIDKYALRVGGEKDTTEEADTVGCCSLRHEHITLREPNLVTFDFLGKDSIRFYQPDKEVDPQVFKNLKLFKKGSKTGDDLFDRVKPPILNAYFTSFMKGLTAKVFRTYNASILLQEQLKKTPDDASVADKILHYNRANRVVAELCNHQRAAAKNHGQAMEKLADKVKAIKYQRMKLRFTLWAADEGNKKKHKQYLDLESDLDDEWMEAHEEDLVEKEKAKIRKKWEKDNEKRKAEGEKELTEEELDKLLEGADAMGEEIKEERTSKHVEPKKSQTTAKILDALVKIDQRIDTAKIAAVDKEEGKEISLTTSKINYMDPRVTVAWCKKHDVPIEKMLSKTLRTKFVWAMDVEPDWEF